MKKIWSELQCWGNEAKIDLENFNKRMKYSWVKYRDKTVGGDEQKYHQLLWLNCANWAQKVKWGATGQDQSRCRKRKNNFIWPPKWRSGMFRWIVGKIRIAWDERSDGETSLVVDTKEWRQAKIGRCRWGECVRVWMRNRGWDCWSDDEFVARPIAFWSSWF